MLIGYVEVCVEGCASTERVCCKPPETESFISVENSLKLMRLSLSVSSVVNRSLADFLIFWKD